ncbi:glycosyltransferase family 2 protein [Pseudomonadota bacterium]
MSINTNKSTPLSIVIPAKNEGSNLAVLLPDLLRLYKGAEIIVVNDGSTDDTLEVCEQHGITCITQPYSKGNGAAVKAGARAASGTDIVFMDADLQHDPNDIEGLLEKYRQGYDMVVGARHFSSHANLGRGMANRMYNTLASWMVNRKVEDLTSGFRVVNADRFREFLHLLPNGFSYPTTSTMAFFRAGYSVAYHPIRASKRQQGHQKSHIRPVRDGLRFLLIIFKVGTLYSPLKIFAPISGLYFIVGLGYYVFTYITQERFTNMSALLFTVSILVFLIGLISEQITALLYRPGR